MKTFLFLRFYITFSVIIIRIYLLFVRVFGFIKEINCLINRSIIGLTIDMISHREYGFVD